MPRLTMPLGSASAYGSVGKAVVYQGTWARQYVAPRDPRTAAQLDVRNLFRDVTKTLGMVGSWGRASFRTNFGARWYQRIYGFCQKNEVEAWSEAENYWSGFSGDDQAAWDAAAPYQATVNEPGRIFYNLAHVCYILGEDYGEGGFGLRTFGGDDSAEARTWWDRELVDVATPGYFDNDGGFVAWGGSIVEIEDVNAVGGSFLEESTDISINGNFAFIGRGVRITYKESLGAGTWLIHMGSQEAYWINQSGPETVWQQVWTSPILPLGLHMFVLERETNGPLNLDAIEIV